MSAERKKVFLSCSNLADETLKQKIREEIKQYDVILYEYGVGPEQSMALVRQSDILLILPPVSDHNANDYNQRIGKGQSNAFNEFTKINGTSFDTYNNVCVFQADDTEFVSSVRTIEKLDENWKSDYYQLNLDWNEAPISDIFASHGIRKLSGVFSTNIGSTNYDASQATITSSYTTGTHTIDIPNARTTSVPLSGVGTGTGTSIGGTILNPYNTVIIDDMQYMSSLMQMAAAEQSVKPMLAASLFI